MAKKIFWLSRHDLSSAQQAAIRDLHGEDAEVVKESITLPDEASALTDYIREKQLADPAAYDIFIYAVAGAPHYIYAALEAAAGDLSFGVFQNHPQKRVDGNFGLAAVYHVRRGQIKKVWVNPDPNSDEGEALIPVAREA